MNLQPITPPLRPGQRVQCCRCHRLTADAVADLDGPAFVAYYCPDCQPCARKSAIPAGDERIEHDGSEDAS